MAETIEEGDGEAGGYRWLNEYEKTWEVLQEDNVGSIQASIDDIVHKAKRKRLLFRKGNVRLGMMRHLYVIVDMSKTMKESDLLRPSKLACANKLLEQFIIEYFDQNPISQRGLISTKNKRAFKLTELSGNPRLHITALQEASSKGPEGEPSIQNSLNMALGLLRHLPSHASREVLLVYGSLTSCDPGNIFESIKELKEHNIRCSVIGLSAEIKLCKTLCSDTNGLYNVILDEKHFQDLLLDHVRPPEAKSNNEASLIRMGFPKHSTNDYPSLCMCHLSSKQNEGFGLTGYFCPQCNSKYCELPIECKVCALTLVSAPHLARSYQHLFPLPAFEETDRQEQNGLNNQTFCQGCQKLLQDNLIYMCKKCQCSFCNDCDLFIHETLHACPGCSSRKRPQEAVD